MKTAIIASVCGVSVLALSYGIGYYIGGADKERDLTIASYTALVKKFNENSDRVLQASNRVQTEIVYKDRYFHTKEKEIEKVSLPMAHCPVPDDAVRLWNEAADCATGNPQALCGSGS